MIDKIALELGTEGFDRVLNSMRNFADQQVGLNTSGTNTAFLGMLGGFLGVNPGAAAMGAYRNSQSGFGLIANTLAGNRYQNEMLEPVDYGQRYIRQVERIVQLLDQGNIRQARMEATWGGIQETLKLGLLSKEARDRMLAVLQEQSNPYSEYSKARAEFDAQMTIFLHQIERAFIPPVTAFLKKFNIPITDPKSMFYTPADARAAGSNANHPVNANTEALNANTNQLRAMAGGIFGGGARSRNALPAAFQVGGMFHANQIWRSATFRLGAYAIGM